MTKRGKYILYGLLMAALVLLTVLDYVKPDKTYPLEGRNLRDLDAASMTQTIAKVKRLRDASELYTDDETFDIILTKNFDWAPDGTGTVRFLYVKNGTYQSAQLRIYPDEEKYFVTASGDWHEPRSLYHLQDFLEALQYLPQEEICALQPDADLYHIQLTPGGTPEDSNRTITYSLEGVTELDGWYIHLTIYPMHANEDSGYTGYPQEAIELFYGRP